ncbi:MAG: hypothetical protein LBL91_06315 [Lachnospiraceae bacterium]|jgi:hypothetical protein|nr:hypothetical protein [Lachnospiraceae bacterium]
MKCHVCSKETDSPNGICKECKKIFDNYTQNTYESKEYSKHPLRIMAYINLFLVIVSTIWTLANVSVLIAGGILISGLTLYFFLTTIVDIYEEI